MASSGRTGGEGGLWGGAVSAREMPIPQRESQNAIKQRVSRRWEKKFNKAGKETLKDYEGGARWHMAIEIFQVFITQADTAMGDVRAQ